MDSPPFPFLSGEMSERHILSCWNLSEHLSPLRGGILYNIASQRHDLCCHLPAKWFQVWIPWGGQGVSLRNLHVHRLPPTVHRHAFGGQLNCYSNEPVKDCLYFGQLWTHIYLLLVPNRWVPHGETRNPCSKVGRRSLSALDLQCTELQNSWKSLDKNLKRAEE